MLTDDEDATEIESRLIAGDDLFALQEAYDIEDIAHVLMVDRAACIEREAALTSALEKCRHALARITAGMGVVCHPDGRLVVEWHPVLEIATVALTETAAALGVTPRSP